MNDRYTAKCKDCPNWKYMCWVKLDGELEPTKCKIYTAYNNRITSNWQSIGCTNR